MDMVGYCGEVDAACTVVHLAALQPPSVGVEHVSTFLACRGRARVLLLPTCLAVWRFGRVAMAGELYYGSDGVHGRL